MAQYLKPDSELGYIENGVEIDFQKFNNLRHTILGCMLGDFNDVGNYVVAPEIRKELIAMEKYIVDTYDNIELCKSALKLDKQISFMVTFEGNKATLSLIEKINFEANYALNSGTYSNINEYVLDEVETSGEVNRNAIYQRWNIKAIPGTIIDIFNCDPEVLEKYFGIVNRFKYILEANKTLLENEEKIEEVEAVYANDILKILTNYSKLNKQVEKDIKSAIVGKKNAVKFNKPYFAKTINEILENAIAQNISLLSSEEKQQFIQEKNISVLKFNIQREEVLSIAHVNDESVDDKELSPKVVKLELPSVYQSKTIEELGQDLISANKAVLENKDSSNTKNNESLDLISRTILAIGEKKGLETDLPLISRVQNHSALDDLLEALTAIGVAKEIGLPQKEKVESVNTTEPKTEQANAEQKKTQPIKQSAPKSENVKGRPQGQSTQKKGQQQQKKQSGADRNNQTDKTTQTQVETPNSTTRIYSLGSTVPKKTNSTPETPKKQDQGKLEESAFRIKKDGNRDVNMFVDSKDVEVEEDSRKKKQVRIGGDGKNERDVTNDKKYLESLQANETIIGTSPSDRIVKRTTTVIVQEITSDDTYGI